MTRKGINYGIEGFDLTLYFVNALKIFGPRFILSLDDYHPVNVLEPYSFSRVSNAGGYENTSNAFFQFHPDMTITRYEVPPLPSRGYFFRSMDDGRPRFLIDQQNSK